MDDYGFKIYVFNHAEAEYTTLKPHKILCAQAFLTKIIRQTNIANIANIQGGLLALVLTANTNSHLWLLEVATTTARDTALVHRSN